MRLTQEWDKVLARIADGEFVWQILHDYKLSYTSFHKKAREHPEAFKEAKELGKLARMRKHNEICQRLREVVLTGATDDPYLALKALERLAKRAGMPEWAPEPRQRLELKQQTASNKDGTITQFTVTFGDGPPAQDDDTSS